ncbi:hypothetical protein ACH5RR_003163 [Cinchona calisaya]|uniref:RNase H type-1 domain-containing protein n=1 Tax=Cinchona calisaya TaxID=153742 RepID=A0ABD3AUP4_9GENT
MLQSLHRFFGSCGRRGVSSNFEDSTSLPHEVMQTAVEDGLEFLYVNMDKSRKSNAEKTTPNIQSYWLSPAPGCSRVITGWDGNRTSARSDSYVFILNEDGKLKLAAAEGRDGSRGPMIEEAELIQKAMFIARANNCISIEMQSSNKTFNSID